MKWKIGDGLRVSNNTEIQYGEDLTNGMLYAVVAIDKQGLPQVVTDDWHRFEFTPSEMQYVERIPNAFDDEEDTERNAELGEPSVKCIYRIQSEIYDEVLDMKAMIGRLLRNGGDE